MPFQVAPIARHAAFAGGRGALIGAHPRVYPSPFQYAGRFAEYYCTNGGSNLNSGTDENNAARYTTTNGNWSTTTLQFIPTDSSIPIGTVFPGDIVSIYTDGATTTGYLARVTAVADGPNGAITVVNAAGTAPTTSATARSLKLGGAWKGPNGAVTWPMNINMDGASNSVGDMTRVNFKNDQTYSMTVGLVVGSNFTNYWGYSVKPGDGGKATFDAGGGNFTLLSPSNGQCFADLIFQNNTTGVTTALVQGQGTFFRCVFHDAGGPVYNMIPSGATSIQFFECEFYKGNLANGVNSGVVGGSTSGIFYHCYFHDGTGPNGRFVVDVGNVFVECIFAECQTDAIGQVNDVTNWLNRSVIRCTFYNIAGACINMFNPGGTPQRRETCYDNLVVNCGSFVSIVGNVSQPAFITIFNTGYFNVPRLLNLNLMARGVLDIGSFALSGDPFVSAATGDFRLATLDAVRRGRGVYTETAPGKSGTTSYPDVGAVQAAVTGSGGSGGNTVSPYGYVGLYYFNRTYGMLPATITLFSGTLPPGLNLSQTNQTEWVIVGTPTTVGLYNFVLQSTNINNGAVGFINEQIQVLAAPVSGSGGVSGG